MSYLWVTFLAVFSLCNWGYMGVKYNKYVSIVKRMKELARIGHLFMKRLWNSTGGQNIHTTVIFKYWICKKLVWITGANGKSEVYKDKSHLIVVYEERQTDIENTCK